MYKTKKNWIALPLLGLTMVSAQAAEPLALQGIMKELGQQMRMITDAIIMQDFAGVEQAARVVADHPKPPFGEKLRILGFAGSNVGKFKAYDKDTHEQAKSLATVAASRDAEGVIQGFARLQTSCLACHSEFRRPFVEHFYGADRSDGNVLVTESNKE